MHNAASTGSKAEINFLPSFNGRISAVVLTDTFSSGGSSFLPQLEEIGLYSDEN